MIRQSFALAAVVALAACAAPMSPQEAYAIASRSADWELCYVAISGRGSAELRGAVNSVMQSRRVNCNDHAAIVSAKMRQDAANSAAQTQLGLQLMQAGQARPIAPQPAMSANCRSYNRGTYVQTVCD